MSDTPILSAPEKPQIPIGFVIFGVTGDLTRRKLIPALYQLAVADQIPEDLHIIGFARRDWDDETMQAKMRAGVLEFARRKPVDDAVLDRLLGSMRYVRGSFDDPEAFARLHTLLDDIKAENRLFYLATPPSAYSAIIQNIGASDMASCPSGWVRVVIEKPYGHDLASALELDAVVHKVFAEEQVYRIDHYLGKETVQNILVFRFANGIFEPLWNRNYIGCVQITVAETVGVGTRAGYYESVGVMRDMFQNHILQLLTLTAMEAPVTFNADAVRDEKLKVLRALPPLQGAKARENTLRAQYSAGKVAGQDALGYKDEQGVAKDSDTETFLAARLEIDSWRWAGVPFFVRSGKRMPQRVTEIAIQFKQVPLPLFGWRNLAGDAPNQLILNIQPEEGITLTFGAKQPGPVNQISPVEMHFSYDETFGGSPPEAYERLLLDAMNGDATLFTRSDEVQEAWRFTTDILDAWEEEPIKKLPTYAAGTWGPASMDEFLQRHDQQWRKI
ncbi:MAG: glucose-6-phosphate dehydrogenase [Chloroflexi bacterium]|nr:glucose-6-phosphate dehydrogenase [Chloroflexota bacterium]